ncbi:aspartate aminotransferase family protein, partial [Sphingobacteriales bacterium CHB3]|nr:aspartate aminotransferase family protein [Sphingobacteriales bacterium CHB3]
MSSLFEAATKRSLNYLQSIQTRNVGPTVEAVANLRLFDEPLPENPTEPEKVLQQLDEIGS